MMAKRVENVGSLRLWIVIYMLIRIENGDCECSKKLINRPNGVEDSFLTASSFYDDGSCVPEFVRITNDVHDDILNAWCPATDSKSEYLQVEFRQLSAVTAFITQGRAPRDQYMTLLTMKTSLDGSRWSEITDESGNRKIFQANKDSSTTVTHTLNKPILANFVRIHPEAWNGWPSFRLEMLGCPKYLGPTCWMGKIGIPNQVLPLLQKTSTSNNGLCGKECFKYPSCGSFMFDLPNMECHLYSIESFNVTTASSSALNRKVYFVKSYDCIP